MVFGIFTQEIYLNTKVGIQSHMHFLNNEKKIALTIHKIDKNIDQGKLLYKNLLLEEIEILKKKY